MSKPPDAPRQGDRQGAATIVALIGLALIGTIGLAGFALLAPPPGLRSAPIATPASPVTRPLVFPTADPAEHLAYVAIATFYAPTSTPIPPTATPPPTPDDTLFCLPALIEANRSCEWPQPTPPPPPPLPTCRTPVPGDECLPRDPSVFEAAS